ncbi:MAG TPA: protein-export chaperone SecB [Gammaproteobacteria bacterium]
MTDEKRDDERKPAQPGARNFGLQRIYLKDVSFESPQAPAVFQGEWKPTLNVNIGTRARALQGDLHEVVLSVTVEAKQDDKVAFLVELQQAGVFLISGFSAEEKQQIAAILCPQNLFPFAREEISNLTAKGGFPQILLQPINFERIFQQGNQPPAGKA